MKLKLLLLSTFCFCTGTLFAVEQPKKAWTILVYLAADNDLNKYAQPNIAQMMQAGSNDDRNIIVYLAETKQGKKYGKLLKVYNNELVELGHDDNADSGSRAVCLSACRKAFAEHPAEHNALVFWNHGSGCLNMPFADLFKGIAYDQPLDTYLTDKDVLAILQELSQTVFAGNKLDLIGFDACLMAGIELQTSFAPYVDYYVASEELEDGPGWNYTNALSGITSASTPQEVAQGLVSAYAQTYAPQTERYTLSAVDLSKIRSLALNVDAVAKELTQLLAYSYNQEIISLLLASTKPGNVTCFDKPEKPDYIDLDHCYANMLEQIAYMPSGNNELKNLRRLLVKGRRLIREAVVANAVGKEHPRAAGICVYWAQEIIHKSYASLAWTQLYPHWQALMQAFLEESSIF
jgi:hypothetical protein